MPSSNTRICPACAMVMPASFPAGLCPKCLLVGASTPAGAPPEDLEAAERTIPVAPPVSGSTPVRPTGVPSLELLRKLFPELEILDVLGAGGMGAVYKARQPRLNRLIALKIMVCPPGHEADFALRFEREAQVLARLSHPHIVIIYDFGELGPERTGAEPLFYFLMEYVDGTDLGQLIKSRELKSPQSLVIVPQICEALQYAHDQGITHRDIKPANILIDKKGTVKIADFGLAKMITGTEEALMTGLTQTGTAMGTPHYMAPEQWEHPEQVDHRADIYALGVVFYEMLTGERPAGVFEPPSKKTKPPVDKKLDGVVMRAMDKNPDRRYQQAGQIGDDVTRISGANKSRPASANGTSEPKRSPLKPLLAIGIAAALAVGGWMLWQGKPPAAVPPQTALGGPSALPATTLPKHEWVKVDWPGQKTLQNGKSAHHVTQEEITKNGGLRLVNHDLWVGDQVARIGKVQNGGIRLRWKRLSDKAGSFDVSLRGNPYPKVSLWGNSAAIFYGGHTNEFQLQGIPHGGFAPVGQEMLMEIACVGRLLILKRDGVVYGTQELPEAAPADFLRLQSSEVIVTQAELINLDHLSEADALKVLGVDSAVPSIASAPGRAAGPPAIPVPPQSALGRPSALPGTTTATKEAPFVNSLGMKFVPVPITGGPTDGKRVLFSIWETRVQDYEAFLRATKLGWPKAVDVEQGPNHPAANVCWTEGTAFCAWLTERERQAGRLGANESYRLPTDHEWSCAVGIGQQEDAAKLPEEKNMKLADVFPWGTQLPPPEKSGNYWSEELRPLQAAGKFSSITGELSGYRDGFATTAPVGSYAANRLGLHDIEGNLREWCEDWFDAQHTSRALRGGAFISNNRVRLLSSLRSNLVPGGRSDFHGFRVVLADASSGLSTAAAPPQAALGGASALSGTAPLPPFTDREAAEWVLGLGYDACNVKVQILKSGKFIEVRKLADLPAEPFVIQELKVNLSSKLQPELWGQVTDAQVMRLAGLRSLKIAEIRGNLTGASLKVMAHHLGLKTLQFEGLNLRAEDLHHLRSSPLQSLWLPMLHVADQESLAVLTTMPNLWILQLNECLDPALAAALPKLPKLEILRANMSANTTDDVLPLLAERFPQLSQMQLWGAKKIKGDTLSSLKALKSLTTLGLVDTAVNDEALAQIAGMPQLVSLELGQTRITDACLPTLKSFPKLESLQIFQTELTDAALLELASIRSLKKLGIKVIGHSRKPEVTFTEAGIAAFRKLRPDVDVSSSPQSDIEALVPPSPSPPVSPPSPTPSPFTDREAAEWVLGLGHDYCNVKVLKAGKLIEVRKLANLPAEPWVIQELRVNLSTNNQPELWGKVTDAQVMRLAGLRSLKLVEIRGNVTGASLKVMAHHPGLESLLFEGLNLKADDLQHLRASRLQTLWLPMLRVADADSLAVLATMPNLRQLMLNESFAPALAAALPKLPKVEVLRANTSATLTDEVLPLLAERLPQLSVLQLWGAKKLQGTTLGSLMALKSLTTLGLIDTSVNDEGLAQIAGMPQLLTLDLGQTRITDACLPTLKSLPKLETLQIYQTELTDAALLELAAIPTLKRLGTKASGYSDWKPGVTFTEAGIAAFQKLRPDVEVVK